MQTQETLHFVIIILIGVEEEYQRFTTDGPRVRSLECGVALLTRIELWADYADLTAAAFRTKRRYQRHGLLARWSKTLSISHPISTTNLQGLVRLSDECQSFVALRVVCWHSGSATSPIPCPSAIWARVTTRRFWDLEHRMGPFRLDSCFFILFSSSTSTCIRQLVSLL